MNRQFFSFILATALFAAIFTSCDKDDDKTFTVNFVSNGGSAIEPQTVKNGRPAIEPAKPERENYGFGGWHTDNNTFNNRWNFATAVTADMTLYAKWNANEYTVTFDSKGGSAVPPQTVIHSDKATEPAPAPTFDGYIFGGWYKESELTNEWKFDTDAVTANITLYAKWYVQLLENTYMNGKLFCVNEYDDMNRLVKMNLYNTDYPDWGIYRTFTFTYDSESNITSDKITEYGHGGDVTYTQTNLYSKTGNKIVINNNEKVYVELNEELPVKFSWEDSGEDGEGNIHKRTRLRTYEYQNGNLTSLVVEEEYTINGATSSYDITTSIRTYDENKSPFYYCKTPKWFMVWAAYAYYPDIKNNMLTHQYTSTYNNSTSISTYTYDNVGFPLTVKIVNEKDGNIENELTYTYIKK